MNRSEDTLLALRRIIRAAELHARKLGRESGLTPVQLRVLQIAEGKRLSAKQIAETLGTTQATMTAILDRLEARQLIERHRSEADRRRLEVLLTPEGREASDMAPDTLHDLFTERYERLPDWEQAMVLAALERVVDLLNAGDIASTPILDTGDLNQPPPTGN